jgi:hypothetical protein
LSQYGEKLMRKVMVFFSLLGVWQLSETSALATSITWSIIPSSLTVSGGQMTTADIVIMGKPIGVPPSIGAFDFTIMFDPAIVSPTTVAFGPFLGDTTSEALIAFSFSVGSAEIAEVSLLTPAELNNLQTTTFSLATLSFNALVSGSTSLVFSNAIVDDAFGNKIPEPASVFLTGAGLILFACKMLRNQSVLPGGSGTMRRGVFKGIVVTLAVFVFASAARSDSTAIAKAPANPDPKYPQVDTACTLTVKNVKGTPSQGSLEMSCVFTNKTAQAQRFVYCSMLGLKTKAGTTRNAPAGSPNWRLGPVGDTLKCREGGTTGPFRSGWHFGCKEVRVPAGIGMKTGPQDCGPVGMPMACVFKSADSTSGSTIYKPPVGAGITTLKADDFRINYSDSIKFTAAVTKYDPASCKIAGGGSDGKHKDLNAQDTFLVPDSPPASYWLQQHVDFKDPVFRFQPITPTPPGPCDINGDGEIDISDINAIFAARGTRVAPGSLGDADGDGVITVNDTRICVSKVTKQYSLYDDSPCLPNAFPATVPDLPRCPLRAGSAPPLSGDINLFDADTMGASAGTQFPALLDVQTGGDGIARVETIPKSGTLFDIPGGGELFGTVTVCSVTNPVQCLPAVQAADGRRMDMIINIRDASTGELMFFQQGQYIQDTQPPQVTSHSIGFDAARNLLVQVTASDAASSPIHAEFWFSTDGGTTWDHITLDPLSDVLDEPSTQSFQGSVGPFLPGRSIRYFIGVQDVVSNVTYFGVGQVTP